MIRTALFVSLLVPTFSLFGQTIALSPDWAATPKVFATTGALMADSLGLSWEGDSAVTVRLQIVEVIGGQAERFLGGGTVVLKPGSQIVLLRDLLNPMILGDLPVIRWAQAARSVEPRLLTVRKWRDELVAELLGEELTIDWQKEALLVIGMSIEGTSPDETMVLPMLVVRPAPTDGN